MNVHYPREIQVVMTFVAKQTVTTTERQVSGNMTIDEAIKHLKNHVLESIAMATEAL